MSGWPSGLRRQTQEKVLFHESHGVFWSTNVGSNPTSDTTFFNHWMITGDIMAKAFSTEPDLNQRPKDSCSHICIYSPPLCQLSYRWS